MKQPKMSRDLLLYIRLINSKTGRINKYNSIAFVPAIIYLNEIKYLDKVIAKYQKSVKGYKKRIEKYLAKLDKPIKKNGINK